MSLTIVSIFLFTGLTLAQTQKVEKKPQTLCPVDGKNINKAFFNIFQCQKIYFDSTACKDAFVKDPEQYMKKIEDDNVLLASVQKVCPITGKPINKEFYKDYKGRRIYFSSADSIPEFDKNTEGALKKLDEQTQKLTLSHKALNKTPKAHVKHEAKQETKQDK
jgi:YHS domain-containing protein